MRAEILLSLLFTTATFGAVANYRTWMASWSWNPVALLSLNSMIIQKQLGDSHEVADALVAPIRTSQLREQAKAVDAAIAHGISYGLGPQPGPICIAGTDLPGSAEQISDAYLAADHIFELQFVTGILNKENVNLQQKKPDDVKDFKNDLNTGANVAMISSELNCYKAVVMKRTIAAVLATPSTCPPYDAAHPSNVELTAYMSFFCKQLLGTAENVEKIISSKRQRDGSPASEEARLALQRLLKCIKVDLQRFEIPGDEDEEGTVEWTCMDQVPLC